MCITGAIKTALTAGLELRIGLMPLQTHIDREALIEITATPFLSQNKIETRCLVARNIGLEKN